MLKSSIRKGSPGAASRNVPHTRLDNENDFEQVYEYTRELGRGSFGRVYEAQCQTNGSKWAVKSVNKEKAGSSAVKMLEREVNIMKMIDHKHIVCLNEVYETPTKMFLIMELCDEGELCNLLRVRKNLSEKETLTVVKQLADAMAYLHDLDIVHRDLKLENILLSKPMNDEPINIKISDFGLSYIKGSGETMMQCVCGTPMYMAPEVIDGHEYSRQCDIWSIGVILFTLLTGSPPFQAPTEERLFQLIKEGQLNFTHPCWQTINESAKKLLEGMLEVDPAHRCTAMEIKDHPWVNGDNEASVRINVIQMMKEYNAEQKKISMSNDDSVNEDLPDLLEKTSGMCKEDDLVSLMKYFCCPRVDKQDILQNKYQKDVKDRKKSSSSQSNSSKMEKSDSTIQLNTSFSNSSKKMTQSAHASFSSTNQNMRTNKQRKGSEKAK